MTAATPPLTADAIRAMPAGLNMNAWVDEVVFEMPRDVNRYRVGGVEHIRMGVAAYSDDMDHAFRAIEKVYERTGKWTYIARRSAGGYAAFSQPYLADAPDFEATGTTPAEAVCRACLIAILEAP